MVLQSSIPDASLEPFVPLITKLATLTDRTKEERREAVLSLKDLADHRYAVSIVNHCFIIMA